MSAQHKQGKSVMLVLKLDGDGPVYRQIRKAIASKIVNREWRPGHRLPSESELTSLLGVSRMTVNRALRALASEGLLVRRRKAGTFVAEQSATDAPLTILSAEAEANAAGASYVYELLSRQVRMTPQRLVEEGIFAPDTPMLGLVARHFANDYTMMVERRWISLDAVPAAGAENFRDTAPGAWLLRNMPWTEAEHAISAIAASVWMADRLGIEAREPCLLVERRTWSGTSTITYVQLIYPGRFKRLVGRFQPAEPLRNP